MASGSDTPNGLRGRHAAMLAAVGLDPPARHAPESAGRFGDGRRYHFEIASVEGPGVLRAVLEEADAQGVRVDRVSQGSGVMMLSDAALDEMAAIGRERDVEVCLFLGPRGGWDTGGQALVMDAAAGVARGPRGGRGLRRRGRPGLLPRHPQPPRG